MTDTYIGVVHDLPNDAYHASAAMSSSGLKLLAQSPLHYWARYMDPARQPSESTKAQRVGSMIHTATLEPHLFDDLFCVMPEGLDRRTKEGKAIWEEIVASGKEPLTQTDLDVAKGTARAAHDHPVTRVLFEKCDAQTEVSLFWQDPATGVRMRVRPDILVEPCKLFPNGLIADVKSTDDATAEAFAKSVWNWDMHLQAALYPDGFQQVLGTKEPPAFLWLAQEKAVPYANQYFRCGDDLSLYGRKEVKRLLATYVRCLETGKWPGYPTQVQDIELPKWAANVVDAVLSN